MAFLEKMYTVVSDNGTMYRVRPNPDAAPGNDTGVVIEWSEENLPETALRADGYLNKVDAGNFEDVFPR